MMNQDSFFFQAFIYLLAAVVSVPLAKRLGLGSVLGYLLAGMLIGPFALGLVGEEGQDVMHFAEFGVVMMLFLVGLELEPSRLWRLRAPILGLGGLQVVVTSLVFGAIGLAVGVEIKVAIAAGMILSLSSTAIVLQTLQEKNLARTAAGQSSFSVLLFQDIAVIPMLALMPLLGSTVALGKTAKAAHSTTWLDGLPTWLSALAVLGALGGLIVGGRFLVRPAFRWIAKTRLREIFTAAALLLVIAITLLMTKLGLSPALGTFVAGVVLATSEYKHELESEIEPFKGILLGLFFIAVGASIDFALILRSPALMAALVLGLLVTKFAVLSILARIFRMSIDQNFLFSFALAQGGEFAFVLFSFTTEHAIIPAEIGATLVAVVAISMALTPLVMILHEKFVQPRVQNFGSNDRPEDTIDEANPVIIAGYGRFGQIVARLLTANGVQATMLDVDSDQVDLVRRFGGRVYYGDATRHDLLHAAGAHSAKLIVLALDDPPKTLELVHTIAKHFPNLKILARARGRTDAYDLVNAGVTHVYRETFDTSLRVGAESLRLLGFPAYQATRAARAFRRHDEHVLRDLASVRRDEPNYVNIVRQRTSQLEEVLKIESGYLETANEGSWDSDTLVKEFGGATGD